MIKKNILICSTTLQSAFCAFYNKNQNYLNNFQYKFLYIHCYIHRRPFVNTSINFIPQCKLQLRVYTRYGYSYDSPIYQIHIYTRSAYILDPYLYKIRVYTRSISIQDPRIYQVQFSEILNFRQNQLKLYAVAIYISYIYISELRIYQIRVDTRSAYKLDRHKHQINV